jgi:hypothetical protein
MSKIFRAWKIDAAVFATDGGGLRGQGPSHLLCAEPVACRRAAGSISAVLRRRSPVGTNAGAADAPGAWGTWNGHRGQP